MRINHKDQFLQALTCIDPKVGVSGDVPSIIPVYYRFQDVLHIDVESLNSEWRRLSVEPHLIDDFLKSKPTKSLHATLQRKELNQVQLN